MEYACSSLGGLPKGSRDIDDARRQVRDALAALLPYARQASVPLAIEPLHPMFAADRACVNTLAHANDLCDELGAGVGVAVDTYHVWWDPDSRRQIARAGANILAYHVNDWLVPTTDLLLDRGMMGDGVIDLRAIRADGGERRLSRPLRGGNSLRRELVEARSRRGAARLHRAASDGGVMDDACVALSCPGRASARERRSGTQGQHDWCGLSLILRFAILALGPGSRSARPSGLAALARDKRA